MSLDDIRASAHALSKDLHELDVDRREETQRRQTVDAGFAARDETLSTRANDLAVALQNYVPTPPPQPAGPVVTYARMLHAVDDTYPIATQEQRYGLQVIQGDQWHAGQVRALQPGATLLLRPSTPVARRPGDVPGDSTCLPPGQIPDAWMLRSIDPVRGAIIWRERDSDQFVDVGNVDYQRAAAAYLVQRCKADGYDGVWIDEINEDPRWSFPNGDRLPAAYPTGYRYQVAIRAFVNAVTPVLRASGLQVWINLAGDYDSAWANGLARETDGHTVEFFIARGSNETANLTNDYFREALDWVSRRQAEGKPGFYNAQTRDPALVRYALAAFLLATKGIGVFGAGVDPYKVAETVWTPDMDTARKLGRPLDVYRIQDGLYVRDFEHGTVRVNPNSKAWGTFAPTSAVIELK